MLSLDSVAVTITPETDLISVTTKLRSPYLVKKYIATVFWAVLIVTI